MSREPDGSIVEGSEAREAGPSDVEAFRPRIRPAEGMWTMADVTLHRPEWLSREEAAQWLAVLSKAFARGGDVTLPVGAATVELRVPDRVRAEFEVEVDGDEVEIELEFTWSTARRDDDRTASVAGDSGPE